MKRLNFTIAEFTRICWTNSIALNVWKPRLRQIIDAWFKMEWLSVLEGIRPCCATMVSPKDLIANAGIWAKLGLSILPVSIEGTSPYKYSNRSISTELGKPFVFRVVVGKPKDLSGFQDAWGARKDDEIGKMLGYPTCCSKFFQTVWVENNMIDTTWPMAKATVNPGNDICEIEFESPIETNILWRWMGVRPVFHLPCRFDCPETVKIGKEIINIGFDNGFYEEMNWLMEILSWPVEWSALHGIAEIKTPILRVSTQTDATAFKYVVRRRGEKYPSEGAYGLTFPYLGKNSAVISDILH